MLQVEHIPSEGIPGHRPVHFDLALEAASQEVLPAVRAPQVILPALCAGQSAVVPVFGPMGDIAGGPAGG